MKIETLICKKNYKSLKKGQSYYMSIISEYFCAVTGPDFYDLFFIKQGVISSTRKGDILVAHGIQNLYDYFYTKKELRKDKIEKLLSL